MSETEKIYSQKIDPNRKRWDSLILIFKLISMLYIVLMIKIKDYIRKSQSIILPNLPGSWRVIDTGRTDLLISKIECLFVLSFFDLDTMRS